MKKIVLDRIKTIASNRFGDKDLVEKFVISFTDYKSGMSFYPGEIICKLNTNRQNDIIELLFYLEKENILKGYYQIICECCHHSICEIDTFSKIPERVHCDCCKRDMVGIENTFLVFKVL